MREAGTRKRGWLFGSGVDLLLGCGVGSMIVMGVTSGFGQAVLSAWVPGALIILLFALPHYGATLIRVYEDPSDRSKYRIFSVWATVLVACGFVASLYSHLLGSLLLTLYLTWSPWHYTGQNYGIALMLAGRRGVRIAPLAKRFVYASFVTSFLLTLLAIHSGQPEGSYAPVSYGGTVFELLPIGIPHSWVSICIALVGTAYLVSTAGAATLLIRSAGLRAVAPTLTLMATQALWFTLPVAIRHWELASADSIFRNIYTPYGFLWIAGYHSVQYLWITTYYATESESAVRLQPSAWRRRLLFLGKSALAGYAIWTLPALIFAPGLLGGLAYESGLAVMVGAMVNLHHFILDGAVWKLRDGRVAQILLRSSDTGGVAPATGELEPEPVAASPRVPWLRRGAQVVGALCLAYAIAMFQLGDLGFGEALSRGDIESAQIALSRLEWLGRDSPARHTELGRGLARAGDTQRARAAFDHSLALRPSVRGYRSLGLLHEQAREWHRAATAYDSALALDPDNSSLLYLAGRAWLERGRPERAIRLLERAAEVAPEEKLIAMSLARARREAEAGSKP